MKLDDYKKFQRYSGQDWYTGEHYINPNLEEEIYLEVNKYEVINYLQPDIIHKANGESYIRYHDGIIGDYEEFLRLKEIEDLEKKKSRKKYFWELY